MCLLFKGWGSARVRQLDWELNEVLGNIIMSERSQDNSQGQRGEWAGLGSSHVQGLGWMRVSIQKGEGLSSLKWEQTATRYLIVFLVSSGPFAKYFPLPNMHIGC